MAGPGTGDARGPRPRTVPEVPRGPQWRTEVAAGVLAGARMPGPGGWAFPDIGPV
ncbi:hypothetical protein Ate01nite_36330 [Actinoplanes teichomyceticus]|nr:hypothetical protein Ate01nite_36330 [Actinoplanes teichomyceticus]